MPYVFRETQAGEARPASEFPSLPSEVYEETFAQAFEENPIAAILRAKDLGDDYRSGGKRLDFETANKRLKDRGMEGDIKVSEAGITEDALNTLMFRKGIERRRQEVFGQSEGGFGQGAARLGIALGTGLIDPLNVATAFIPVIGEARYTGMLAKSGSVLGRTGVRAGVGAVEGVAGAALIEPIITGSRRYEQADYGMADSLLNITFGGLLGAGLHSVGGAVSDGVTHYRGAEPAWRGLENVSADEIPLVHNLRQEIGRGMDARDVARATETWSLAARRAVEADARAVTPAEAVHQALPPQVRENVLKQAIIQAVSDEPVNVSRIISPHEQSARAKMDRQFSVDDEIEARKILPLHEVRDAEKLGSLSKEMREKGWVGRPILVYDDGNGIQAVTGSHRIAAARSAGIDVPVLKMSDEATNFTDSNGHVLSDVLDRPDDDLEPFLRELGDNEAADLIKAESESNFSFGDGSATRQVTIADDVTKAVAYAEKVLARETDTGTPTADALKMATEEVTLAQSDLKAVADRLGLDAEDAELRDVLEAANNSERWAKAAELATICLTRGG